MSEGGDSTESGTRLRHWVEQYAAQGQDLTADTRLAEAVLLDALPESSAEVRALIEAVRCGAVTQLQDSATHGSAFAVRAASSYLATGTGLRESLCRWAMETWWYALYGVERTGDEPTAILRGREEVTQPDRQQTLRAGTVMPSGALAPAAPGQRLVLGVLPVLGAAVVLAGSVVMQRTIYLADSRPGQVAGALVIVAASAVVIAPELLAWNDPALGRRRIVCDALAVFGAAALLVGSLLMAWLSTPVLVHGHTHFVLHATGDSRAIRWLTPILPGLVVVEVLIAGRRSLWPHRAILVLLAVPACAAVVTALSEHGRLGAPSVSLGKGAFVALGGAICCLAAAITGMYASAQGPTTG